MRASLAPAADASNVAHVIVCWVVGQALSSSSIGHLDPLLSHQLHDFFLPEMLSPDQGFDALAVCASHLIRKAFDKQKIYCISAAHYAKLLTFVGGPPALGTYKRCFRAHCE
jgi:hypothetical protein